MWDMTKKLNKPIKKLISYFTGIIYYNRERTWTCVRQRPPWSYIFYSFNLNVVTGCNSLACNVRRYIINNNKSYNIIIILRRLDHYNNMTLLLCADNLNVIYVGMGIYCKQNHNRNLLKYTPNNVTMSTLYSICLYIIYVDLGPSAPKSACAWLETRHLSNRIIFQINTVIILIYSSVAQYYRRVPKIITRKCHQ